MKSIWEQKLEWWIEDFEFELKQMRDIKEMLKKHPDDEIGKILREILKKLESNYMKMKRKYKSIYGDWPKLNEIKKEINSCSMA